MEADSGAVSEILKRFGVGRRPLDDDFFAENIILRRLKLRLSDHDIDDESLCHPAVSITCHIPRCVAQFDSLMEFDSHYTAAHRYLCCECKKHLPSAHLLDLHCAESHDSFFAVLAERKPSFACYVEECDTKFKNPEERRAHCIADHKFPADFRYDNIKKTQKKTSKPKKQNKKAHQNVAAIHEDNEMSVDAPLNQDSQESAPNDSEIFKKPVLKNFTFGHSKSKGFISKGLYTGRRFTNDSDMIDKSGSDNKPSTLESEDMLVELKDSLLEC